MSLDREFLRCGRAASMAGAASGPNLKAALLGKTPTYAPDRAFDTLHVYLELDIDFARRSVGALCRTTIRAFSPGLKSLVFDAAGLKVASAAVDGRPAKFALKNGKLTLTAKQALESGAEAEVVVRYRVERPEAGLHFVYPGPHNPKNPVQVWSQS